MRVTIAAAILLVAGCGEADRAEESANDVAARAPATPAPSPAPTVAPSPSPTAPEPGAALPPADAEFRFVGRWAADAGACGDPWIWTEQRLETPAATVCEFTNVEAVPGGYDIDARCTAEAPPTDDRIELRFAESARAMLVDSDKVLAPVGLVYCGG